jgi:hypothetical protein
VEVVEVVTGVEIVKVIEAIALRNIKKYKRRGWLVKINKQMKHPHFQNPSSHVSLDITLGHLYLHESARFNRYMMP